MEGDFKKVAIIGAGLIGGSLCRAIRRFSPALEIIAIDKSEHLPQLKNLGLADEYFNEKEISRACLTTDLIILATPVNEAIAMLPQIAKSARKDTVVSDVGSIKGVVLDAAEKLFGKGKATFIGGHPMAGSEKSGALHASPFLFENAIYSLSPLPGTDDNHLQGLIDFLHKLGARVITIDAHIHDRIAASISHMPRILSVALMTYVARKNRENDLFLKMAAGGFRDMTRIASGSYEIWEDIIAGNRDKILDEVDNLISVLNETKDLVTHGDLRQAFEKAAETRLSIPADSRGFLNPLHDVFVEVEDKPGVISAISNALDKQEINIKDIEVLKVRENEGGSMRLAFSTREDQNAAIRLLKEEGFVCSAPQ